MSKYLIYALYQQGELVYIGRTKGYYNLKQRLSSHKRNGRLYDYYDYREINNYEECKAIERMLINKYKPKYNKQCVSGRVGLFKR